ncbi:MAG: hypothetical protein R2745_19520 [Vicinamibacterales bacterium]
MSKKSPGKPAPKPKRHRPVHKKDPCAAAKAQVRAASAIVCQVMAHFGAGYGVQAGAGPDQLFASPDDFAIFHDLLLKSVIKNAPSLDWDSDDISRDAVCVAAFEHGRLARTVNGQKMLDFPVILSTLRTIQATICPPGAGGGPVCDF